eukprot:2924275-Rhodomonas_salina.1
MSDASRRWTFLECKQRPYWFFLIRPRYTIAIVKQLGEQRPYLAILRTYSDAAIFILWPKKSGIARARAGVDESI